MTAEEAKAMGLIDELTDMKADRNFTAEEVNCMVGLAGRVRHGELVKERRAPTESPADNSPKGRAFRLAGAIVDSQIAREFDAHELAGRISRFLQDLHLECDVRALARR